MGDMELLKQLSSIKKNKTDVAVLTQTKRDLIPVHWLLVLKTGIAGLHFHLKKESEHGAKVLRELVPGTELIMERDYSNEYDQWAIAIYTPAPDKEMIGYMSRYKNETIARLMDYGKTFHAIVDKPVEFARDVRDMKGVKAPTEDFMLPYSVYMEDIGYGSQEDAGGEVE